MTFDFLIEYRKVTLRQNIDLIDIDRLVKRLNKAKPQAKLKFDEYNLGIMIKALYHFIQVKEYKKMFSVDRNISSFFNNIAINYKKAHEK